MTAKVLIVEDEPLLLMLAAELVEEAGMEPVTASNADNAIVLLEQDPDIRILMTDIDMPGSMDGLKLAAAVRNRWPSVQIVVVSGKQRPRVMDLPAQSVFLSKPYDIYRLSETLMKMAA